MKQPRTLGLEDARRLVAEDAVSVERLHGAGISDVFEIVTGDRTVVVKLFPPDHAWKLAKELSVYRLLQEHAVDVPTPRVLAADEQEHLLVLERIEGLSTDRISDRDVPKLYRELGRLQAQLHTIEFDAFGYLTADGVVEPRATNPDYMKSQFAKRLSSFTDLGGDRVLARALAEHVRDREELLVGPAAAVFCHNDCHEGNVLVTVGEDVSVVGLFDFENALAGDPLLDLAKTVAYSRHDRTIVTDAIAEGYGELPAGWRDGLALYAIYHVLELWTWFAGLGDDAHLGELSASLAERLAS